MPVNVDIFDFKCFNQLRNGEDFDENLSEYTPNLVGNVGERVKIEFKANISQTAATQGVEEWFVDLTSSEIVRTSGSFRDDSIQVGDHFKFYDNWENRKSTAPEFIGEVDFISGDGTTIKFTVDSGTATTSGVVTNVGLSFDQQATANKNTALFLKFGLLGNEEPFNYQSKTTDAQQVFYKGSLAADTEETAESLGTIKDWVTGSVTFEAVSGDPDFNAAQFIVTHEFIINPFYTVAYRGFIEDGGIPDILDGDSSLKYAAELEFRKTLTDTGSSKTQSFDDLDGFVGWYGENFNGLNTPYKIKSVAYEDAGTGDPLDAVNINLITKITVVVESTVGSITDYSCGVYLLRVPDSEDQYVGTVTDMSTNFMIKSGIVTSPATTGADVSTSLVSGDLEIIYTVEYNTEQKLLLTDQDEFMLLVQVEDSDLDTGNSDRTMMVAAFRNYVDVSPVGDFAEVLAYGLLQHGEDLEEGAGAISLDVSNEDGVILNAVFGVDTAREVLINGIAVKLIAYNSGTESSFELDAYHFNIGAPVLNVSGIQEINIDTERGYPLPAGDAFNVAKIDISTLIGDQQQYRLQVGQKIKWQEWIANAAVPGDFFNPEEPNNNLNFKTSNYSDEEGYQIKIAIVLDLSGLDDLGRTVDGEFTYFGGDIAVLDYDASDDGVSGSIQTFDIETGNSLDGNILYNGKDTLFKAVFQDAEEMQYAIHRIEPSSNPGDGIIELSSVYLPDDGSILRPVTGEDKLYFNIAGTELTTQSIIDGSRINEGVRYKLSARAGKIPANFLEGFLFTVDTEEAGSASDTFVLPLSSTGTYDFAVDWGDGSVENITSWDQAETIHTYITAGVKEIRIAGTMIGWGFDDGGDKEKMLSVEQWGIFRHTDSADTMGGNGAFYGCVNLDLSGVTDVLQLGDATKMDNFFRGCSNLDTINRLGEWDVSGILSFEFMFASCTLFDDDLGDWTINSSVSNNVSMSSMFDSCTSFNQDLSTWNTSRVRSMSEMFRQCVAYNGPMPNWVVSNCSSFYRMFNGCSSFNRVLQDWRLTTDASLDVDLGEMFRGASAFDQNVKLWGFSRVREMNGMFWDAGSFARDLEDLDLSNCRTFEDTFRDAVMFNGLVDDWVLNTDPGDNVIFRDMFRGATDFNRRFDGWDTSRVTDFSGMLQGATMYNRPLTIIDTSAATTMANMLNGASAYTLDLNGWDTSNVISFAGMFAGASAFNGDITSWDVSSGENFENMFEGANLFNRAIGVWTTTSMTDISSMFAAGTGNTHNFDQDISNWDVSNVTDATDFLGGDGSGQLSTPNYDALLIAWEAQGVQDNLDIDFDQSQYTLGGAAETARANLIADHSWIIEDGGGV